MLSAERYGLAAGSFRSRTTFASITDGLSCTFLMGEKALNKTDLKNSTCGDGNMYFCDSSIGNGPNNASAIRYVMNTSESLSNVSVAHGE